MNGEVSTAMRKNGLDYKVNFGLDAFSIREIASKMPSSVELADKLWAENARECKILATLLHPKEAFSSEKADEWLDQCFVPELTEQLVFNLLQHLIFAPSKASEWISCESEKRKVGGYTLALRLLLRKVELSDLKQLQLATAPAFCTSKSLRMDFPKNRKPKDRRLYLGSANATPQD